MPERDLQSRKRNKMDNAKMMMKNHQRDPLAARRPKLLDRRHANEARVRQLASTESVIGLKFLILVRKFTSTRPGCQIADLIRAVLIVVRTGSIRPTTLGLLTLSRALVQKRQSANRRSGSRGLRIAAVRYTRKKGWASGCASSSHEATVGSALLLHR
jgi:hypothetical protein